MARIRTVKPDFWSHPIMSRQDDATKCMALALLNLSDDEGYFYAEPALVRSFARPLDEDSTITRRCLDQLEKVGWIELSEHSDHGMTGLIISFKDHQSIDRPRPSKIKQYHSTNPRRILDESSSLEQGTGNREIINPKVSPSGKSKREPKPQPLGNYPEELNRAMSVWRDLGRELRSDEILGKFPPEQAKYLASIGTKGKAWEAWQKRVGRLTGTGIKITHAHILEAVKLWAETKYRQAKEGKKLAYPMLSSLINSADFEDALLRASSQEVSNAS